MKFIDNAYGVSNKGGVVIEHWHEDLKSLKRFKDVELFLGRLVENELWVFDVQQNSPLEEIFLSFSEHHLGYTVFAEEKIMYKTKIELLYKIWVVVSIK